MADYFDNYIRGKTEFEKVDAGQNKSLIGIAKEIMEENMI